MELQAFQAALPVFEGLGAGLVAISPQTAANSRKSMRQNDLDYTIRSGSMNEVAASFGLRLALSDALITLYKSLKNDLLALDGDPSWTLSMPARFVIAPYATVLYAEVSPDYTVRPDPKDMLPALGRAARVPA